MIPANVRKIGKYDVLERVGSGGMGVVFRAVDPMLGRAVAIKVMNGAFAEDPALLRRFYREAQSTASFAHPNIVTVYEMGDQEGTPYLVMQFLEGESLQAVIRSRRELGLLTKISYLLQVCHGLQYAHDRSVTHRDIKPANIMVLQDGTVKLVDFGIARIGGDHLTRPGQVMGTMRYMSPEQIDEQEVDWRSDIFSLGTVAYELLTYVPPFEGRDTPSSLLKILHDTPPPLSSYINPCPAELENVARRALEKKKEDRYQSAEEMAFDLAQVQAQLRKVLADQLLNSAEQSMARGELTGAKVHLQQLAQLDVYNPAANRRMRELERMVKEQKLRDHADKLRSQAELPMDRNTQEPVTLSEETLTLDAANAQLEAPKLASARVRESNVLALTPPQGNSDTPPASRAHEPIRNSSSENAAHEVYASGQGLSSFNSAPGWPGPMLSLLEKQLAVLVGPVARILVKKAAARTTDLDEIYNLLAANLEREPERRAFLSRKGELLQVKARLASADEARTGTGKRTGTAPAPAGDLTAPSIEVAAHLLASYVGPIAKVLTQRAALRADSLRSLYQLLAEHLTTPAERERFLRQAGFHQPKAS